MTDIEQKALALLNEVQKGRGHTGSPWNSPTILNEALYRAIEQHEAFRQEVSDAVEDAVALIENEEPYNASDLLSRFIIAKPDPLVEAMQEWWDADGYASIETFRAAIEKRGGKIVWGDEQ